MRPLHTMPKAAENVKLGPVSLWVPYNTIMRPRRSKGSKDQSQTYNGHKLFNDGWISGTSCAPTITTEVNNPPILVEFLCRE
jgi:hypothetical protein